MKIGLIVDDTLDKPDGVQQYVLLVGAWLAKQGHEVHYLAGETKRTDLPNVHSLSKNVRVTFNGNRLTIPLPVPKTRIRRLFREHTFDVLHVMTPHSPALAQRVMCLAPRSTAVVATFHILPHSPMAARLTRVLGMALRPSLRRLQTLMAVSSAAKEFAEQSYRIPAIVVPNVLDVPHFTSAKPFPQYEDKLTLVFLGRLVERKGCTYLLQAVKYIIEQQLFDKPFRVLVCGKGELSDQLQAYVRDNDLESYVEFTGFIDEADKPRYVASADIAVYPSTGGESFGIVLLEAMAASKGVVLAGNNPGYATVLEPHPEQLFDPKDIPEFADLLTSYLTSSSARKKASAWQHDYVQQFDLDVVGKKLEDVYAQALHQARDVQ